MMTSLAIALNTKVDLVLLEMANLNDNLWTEQADCSH